MWKLLTADSVDCECLENRLLIIYMDQEIDCQLFHRFIDTILFNQNSLILIISWHSFLKNSISSDYSHTHYDFHEKNTGFKGRTVAVINCADAQKQLNTVIGV